MKFLAGNGVYEVYESTISILAVAARASWYEI
jgi:hypothetical protein